MERTLKLVGKNSNEIFTLRYPTTLLEFCEYDFSYFAKHSIAVCNESLKTGVLDHDRMAELRRDVQSAHCYIEHNIRTTYEKLVLDCWIDYVCRRDNIGFGVLWNRFIRCKSDFEKAVFSRLCDFRYNRAINEWLNIVRVQDYARCKTDFIFVEGINDVEEAVARRNYFDLTFSVTAREMGCRIEDLGVVKAFSVGRVPTAPFLFPTVSKDIVRNVLADFDYSEDYSGVGDYTDISDKIAMDAFSKMKAGLPQDLANYGVVRGKMDGYVNKIYMPCSLKAAIDLEIDAIIENSEWLAKCKRCGRYFLRDKDHREEYCSRLVPNGKTCLEIWEEKHPKPSMTEALERKSREVTDKMYARVDKTMSVKEYEYWRTYLEAMKQKVRNGEISPEELESFLDYSLDVDISKSTPIVEVPKKEQELRQPAKERVVKPFMPERISRAAIPQPIESENPDPDEELVLKEGFFTSPTKQRKKNEAPRISHVIRNGESLGRESYDPKPDPAGFQPFGAQFAEQPPDKTPQEPRRSAYEDLQRLERRLEEEKRIKRERAEEIARRRELDEEEEVRRTAVKAYEEPLPFFAEEFPRKSPQPPLEQTVHNEPEPPFPIYDEVPEEMRGNVSARPSPQKRTEKKPPEIQAPKPKVIKKNAAAISAYGKAAGAPVLTAPQADIILPRDEKTVYYFDEDIPDSEPFKDIGSIFDVLEQSESGEKTRYGKYSSEPLPERVNRENAPEGIWTEDRSLFTEQPEDKISEQPEQSELDMLKSKKHMKSNKTRRLYDVIMREPDDNPNFRKKK